MERIEILECRWCDSYFFLCRRCYRGQVYCGQYCRDAARAAQCRQAQQNYMATEKGQERLAAAVAAYRARQRAGLTFSRHGPTTQGAKKSCNRSRSFFQRPTVSSWPKKARCSQCGRLGRAISPLMM